MAKKPELSDEEKQRLEEQERKMNDALDFAVMEDVDEIVRSGGRDSLLIRQFFLTLYRCGTIEQTIVRVGMGYGRYQRWRNEVPGFVDAVNHWQENVRLSRVKETMFERATDRNDPAGVKAAELLLKAYERQTFGDKLEVDTRLTVQHVVQAGESARERALKRVSVLRERGLPHPSVPAPVVEEAMTVPVRVIAEPAGPDVDVPDMEDDDDAGF